ncbi:MAG: FRG domain-containing protein [Leptospirales bacterium]|nr:FRG domain-containing protein [Leptospirales bacterium]
MNPVGNPDELIASDANEFFDWLLPNATRWQPPFGHTSYLHLRDNWIFRGEGDADRPVLPSAHRQNSLLPYIKQLTTMPLLKSKTGVNVHTLRELQIVHLFLRYGDTLGLNVPIDAYLGRKIVSFIKKNEMHLTPGFAAKRLVALPLHEFIDAFALAQHSALPTRLLDWTRNGLSAAYFAGTSALKKFKATPTGDKYLVVYAINTEFCNIKEYGVAPIKIVLPPARTNSNLLAQQGVLLFDEGANYRCYKAGTWVDFEKAIANQKTPYGPPGIFFKLKLEWKHSKALLKLLTQFGIVHGSLFPGLQSLKQTMIEYREIMQ